jgi:membrane protease YdiL (CAAX protease family)
VSNKTKNIDSNIITSDIIIPVQDTGSMPAIVALIFSVIVSVMIFMPVMKNISDASPFLMSLMSYFWIILPLALVQTGLLLTKLSPKTSVILSFLLIPVSGYAVAEIVYRVFTLSVPTGIAEIMDAGTVTHLENFFLHRLYHILPLAACISLFYMFPSGYFTNFLKFGSLSTKTNVISGKGRFRRWYAVVRWFTAWVIVIFIILAIFTLWKNSFRINIPAGVISAFILYAVWNCFVEETLFRGILLSVFSKTINLKTALLTQAFLFGIVHIDPSDVNVSIMKVILFAFIGWFFGRAAKETEGIGASFIMHTALVIAIEMRLLL